MRKLLIILLGLIAFSLLGWFAVYQTKAPDIQTDIKKRVGEALESNSLDWVDYDVDGRDVTLSGVAQNEQMAQHAKDTADIYGLNSLSSNITFAGGAATDDAAKVAAATGAAVVGDNDGAEEPAANNQADAKDSDQAAEDQSDTSTVDVAVQDVATGSVAALPIVMNIAHDASGEYIFNGTVPNMELKQKVDQHLVSVGADPAKAVWQVELSSAEAPKDWEPNLLNTISAIQLLQEGEANLTADEAVIKGSAATQDTSDAAEVFAQKIAGDFTTEMSFSIAEATPAKAAAGNSEELPLVGSDQYAAKYCQAEFNSLLKQQKIVFDSGSSNLQASSAALLDKISQVAGRCSNQAIEVNGYTDSQGAASANRALSKVRAEAVVAYLSQKGIDSGRLIAIGHGEKNPVATNKTTAGRAQNRRIKLIVKGLKK